MLVRAPPVLAPLRRPDPSSSRDTESVQIAITHHYNTPTSGTVPAVRPAHGHVLLPPKRQAAVAAVAATHVEPRLVPKAELFRAPSPVALLLVEERRVLFYAVSRRARRRREGDARC